MMTSEDCLSRPALPVARFLAVRQTTAGVDDSELAAAAALSQDSIRLIKDGKMKLPVGAIRPGARSLDVSAQQLLQIMLGDYMPELHLLMEELRTPLELTKNEREMLARYRPLCRGRDAVPVVVSGITLLFPKSI